MEKNTTRPNQEKKLENLHCESLQWKSYFHFMDDELLFINRLLNSYVYEPNTPNLFERLMEYKSRITAIEGQIAKVKTQLTLHENELGGVLECLGKSTDKVYKTEHETIKAEALACIEAFQELKMEIFNYAGSILRKNKSKN